MIKRNTLVKCALLPFFVGMSILGTSIAYAIDYPTPPESEQSVAKSVFSVQAASANWAKAVNSHNVEDIVALYNDLFVLYPTFDRIIDTHDGLVAYFTGLAQKEDLKVVFDSENLRVGDGVAVDSGLYTFSYKEGDTVREISARFTFVFLLTPEGWKIIDHHSSVSP